MLTCGIRSITDLLFLLVFRCFEIPFLRVKFFNHISNALNVLFLSLPLFGNKVKKRIVAFYKADLESSDERLEQWKNGEVSASERRILFTKWLADSWEDYTSNNQDEITKAFKKCDMYNDIHGKENHLIKLDRLPSYKPPNKDGCLMDDSKKRCLMDSSYL